MGEFVIGVVGNCASGKTTLVQGLSRQGWRAVNIPQEHSVSPRFWRRLQVDYLVSLSCTLATAKSRRRIPWGQERLDAQAEKLNDARQHCQLHLDTDHLTIEQVLQVVLAQVSAYRRGASVNGEDNVGESPTPPEGGDVHSLWA